MNLSNKKISYSLSLSFVLFLLISPMFFGPLIALLNPEFFEGHGDTNLNLGSTLFIARNLAVGLAFLFAIYMRSAPMLFILILVRLITDLIDFPVFQIFRGTAFDWANYNFYFDMLFTCFLWVTHSLERNEKSLIIFIEC